MFSMIAFRMNRIILSHGNFLIFLSANSNKNTAMVTIWAPVLFFTYLFKFKIPITDRKAFEKRYRSGTYVTTITAIRRWMLILQIILKWFVWRSGAKKNLHRFKDRSITTYLQTCML